MSGYIDLHCHYLPKVDDGVSTFEEGVALCQALKQAGFDTVVATPHIRSGMFPNEPQRLRTAFDEFARATAEQPGMPSLALGAEHHFDDNGWHLLTERTALTYPGGRAALVEFPDERFPVQVEQRLFELAVNGLQPVLAHPERYAPLLKNSDALEPLLNAGVVALLDLMALVGHYGRRPRRVAERLLDEGLYFAACSDAHRPSDVAHVVKAIEKLQKRVGADEADAMLHDRPHRLLQPVPAPQRPLAQHAH